MVLMLLMLSLLSACSAQSSAVPEENKSADLVFDVSELGSEPMFIDWEQDGTAMQLVARRDENGEVRLAFNTCQSCGGSPYAWFEYIGADTLQCQNCGLTFNVETVGTSRAAGCNPVTIVDFTVKDQTVTVPQSLLQAMAPRFANWKVFD